MQSTVTLEHNLFYVYFQKKFRGSTKFGLLEDNFVSESYRLNFKKAGPDYFMKKNFDISTFCSNKYNDKNTNMLSRLQNTVAAAINKKESPTKLHHNYSGQ